MDEYSDSLDRFRGQPWSNWTDFLGRESPISDEEDPNRPEPDCMRLPREVSVMPLSLQDIVRAIALIDDRRSLQYAARTIGAPYTTVQEAVKRFRETQSYSRRPGSGRKRINSGRGDRFLVSQVLRYRHTTAVEAWKRLQQVRRVNVNEWTVR
ncbi:hypothetical protein C0J52_14425 [Blattella germanica]|nr:hypothetical protein C0J52_14425 [Blattella germanica]